jgi:perosamine synthetase
MIPVNEPLIASHAKKYVIDCLDSGWISSSGTYLEKFEEAFASYLGVRYATTTTNGTTALHLALAALRLGPGDEIIIPDLTIVSCGLAALYVGATPVVADVDPVLGTIDPAGIERAITKRTRAIMVVHLWGHPANMDPILEIAKRHHLAVVEDAAEAHGAMYLSAQAGKGKRVGGIGDIGCFSFYGNKIVTTGEGGMVVTNNTKLYERAKLLKNLAHSPQRRFYHEEVGFNFRMTNLQAALGLAQLEEIDRYIRIKQHMAHAYQTQLSSISSLILPSEASWATSVWWMYAVLVSKTSPLNRDTVRAKLKEAGIDTRDYFIPLHRQPVFTKLGLFKGASCPVSDDLSRRGFYLPSGLAITDKQIRTVTTTLKRLLP